ncbi:MAG: hypothetical protein JXA60_05495 [Candidatus Coatesbacteria bacterium]|nr:hypothetical protein [Candidatus Coatesbacteria bacterium]
MPFKEERFQKSFKKVIKKEVPEEVKKNLSQYKTKTTPSGKAGYIKDLLKELSRLLNSEEIREIMQECGKECISKGTLKTAKELHKESKDLKEFLARLNEYHIGGGHLELNGNIINACYTKCYCGSVNNTRESIPLDYCYCSTGWYKRLFEEVLQKPVKVEIIQSIVNGADKCLFNIYI